MLRVVNLIIFICSLVLPIFSVSSARAETPPQLIITEVKVRTDTTNLLDFDEFIEIYNSSDQPVDLANYNLEYYNATNPPLTQQPVQKSLFNYLLDTHAYLTLAKQPIQIANSKQSPFSSLSDSGGRLRLVTSEGIVVDEIAWSNSQSLATEDGVYPAIVYQCNSSTVLCNGNRIESLSRSQDQDGNFVLSSPIWILSLPSPHSSELLAYPVTDTSPEDSTPPADPDPLAEMPEQSITCEGIILSELLPNPAGTDSGKEFIELYNPTNEIINLSGCSLQTSSSTKKYTFQETIVNPGLFIIFPDSVTGLTLPNSAGGTVWLLSPSDELSSITYPGGIDDDSSWSFIDGIWQITYTPSPGAQNIAQPIKPCPEGQTRSSVTNRCQAPVIATVSTLAPCKAGQERNIDTGRCRTIISTIGSLTPCKEGQERNPETNRCRSVNSNVPTPCPEGQERNPDTNRCRKAGSNGETLAAVSDVQVTSKPTHPKWLLGASAVVLALGYALFEWKNDFLQLVRKLKS